MPQQTRLPLALKKISRSTVPLRTPASPTKQDKLWPLSILDSFVSELNDLETVANKKTSKRRQVVNLSYDLGMRALEKKNGGIAARAFDICLKWDPNNIGCHWERGWSNFLEHEYLKTQADWQWVLKLAPKHDKLAKSLDKINIHVKTMNFAKKLSESAPPTFEYNRTLVPEVYTRLQAVGDTMIGTDYPYEQLPPSFESPFAFVQDTLGESDLTFMNHEGTLCDGGNSIKCQGSAEGACYAFRTPTKYSNFFVDAGFNLVSLANNHIMDFGETCRDQTEQTFTKLGIFWSGRAGTLRRFVSKEIKFSLISFHSAGHTNSTLDIETAIKMIKTEKEQGQLVIVSFHGGAEGIGALHVPKTSEYFFGENRGDVYQFAHSAIDAGADLILGSGPHVVRGLELYKNRLIAYSLGNFSTYRTFNLLGFAGIGAILEVDLSKTGEFAGGKIHSTKQIEFGIPILDKNKRSVDLIRYLSIEDFPDSPLIIARDGSLGRKP